MADSEQPIVAGFIEDLPLGEIRETDVLYIYTNDNCCSRCRQEIAENEVPLCVWPNVDQDKGESMYMFCARCSLDPESNRCKKCGCTDTYGCEMPCGWVTDELCTNCANQPRSTFMKIKSMLSAGEVFVTPRGDVELLPMQIFRTDQGTVLRVGDNVYHFDRSGRYDGSEHKNRPGMGLVPDDVANTLKDALKKRGRRPTEPYYMQGTDGFFHETRSWPSEHEEHEATDEEDLVEYVAVPGKPKPN